MWGSLWYSQHSLMRSCMAVGDRCGRVSAVKSAWAAALGARKRHGRKRRGGAMAAREWLNWALG